MWMPLRNLLTTGCILDGNSGQMSSKLLLTQRNEESRGAREDVGKGDEGKERAHAYRIDLIAISSHVDLI